MFGVATKDVPLTLSSYGHLLGKDNQSWGLSSNGEIWHNGKSREYCKPFEISQTTRIGILFDGDAGTLSFYKNGKHLGLNLN
jgi:SPRY domain-containing SOCS box protein 3